MVEKLTLLEWLDERRFNAVILAHGKTGEIRDGWLEDADYYQRAIDAIRLQEPPSADTQPSRASDALEEVRQMCRDYSSRYGNVYILDVLSSLDGIEERWRDNLNATAQQNLEITVGADEPGQTRKWMPVEPTPEMVWAGNGLMCHEADENHQQATAAAVWRVMVQAAPYTPSPTEAIDLALRQAAKEAWVAMCQHMPHRKETHDFHAAITQEKKQ